MAASGSQLERQMEGMSLNSNSKSSGGNPPNKYVPPHLRGQQQSQSRGGRDGGRDGGFSRGSSSSGGGGGGGYGGGGSRCVLREREAKPPRSPVKLDFKFSSSFPNSSFPFITEDTLAAGVVEVGMEGATEEALVVVTGVATTDMLLEEAAAEEEMLTGKTPATPFMQEAMSRPETRVWSCNCLVPSTTQESTLTSTTISPSRCLARTPLLLSIPFPIQILMNC